ncbi:MAG: CNNM domain-containing protein, partial [Acidobacteriota bacterium]
MVIASIIVLLLAVNALYVAGEYAVVSMGRARAQRLVREKRAGARRLLAVKADPACLDRTLTACQIGISASSMILGAYSQTILVPVLEPLLLIWPGLGLTVSRSTAVVLTLLFITALQVVLGEQVPKSLAVRNPSRWSLMTILPLSLSRALFSGLITMFGAMAGFLLRILGIHSVAPPPAPPP